MQSSLRSHLLSSASLVITVAFAFASQAQTVPNTARPETIERQQRIEMPRPDVGGAPVITTPDEGKKHTQGGASFMLKGIKLEGATVYDDAELRSVYGDKLNTKVTLGELNEIADAVTSYYRNHGYILSRAVVPPQKANNGIITLRIIEGFVNDVRLQGDVGKERTGLLQAYADKIKAEKPLNAEKLERYLLLMEDLPGVEARAVLQPAAKTPGASDVVVTISRKPVEFSASVDNRGSRYLGPIQGSAGLFLNNMLGMDELTQLRVTNSFLYPKELAFGEIRHIQNIGHEGTTLTLVANKTLTQPGDSLKSLDIKGESGVLSVGANHPIIRSRRTNWFVNGDFTARDVEVDTLGTSLYKDKTRVLRLGTAYDMVDRFSAIDKAEVSVYQGFNWGTERGANNRSRANGETDFTKGTARLTRIQPLFGAFSLFTAATGQYSVDPLVASEEFTLGGSEFGSAHDSAEISGDSGVAGRAELQYNQANVNKYIDQYQVYAFYDVGKVWNIDSIAGSEKGSEALSSTGLGLRFNMLESITGGVEGAVPIKHRVAARNEDGNDPRVFFNLQYHY